MRAVSVPHHVPRERPAAGRSRIFLAAALALAVVCGVEPVRAQEQSDVSADQARRTAEEISRRLTPERRVGQLFLVPFEGAEVTDGAAIARLIDAYGIGGVLLSPARGNYVNAADAPVQVARLANQLQTRASASEQPFVPLFVAIEQAGDVFPGSQLWGGMTALPSEMSIGATWQPELAERIGAIVGRELAAAGVNLLLGPQLDVVRVPRPGSSGDLGVRTFGGSAAWVAQFGQAYIAGAHRGASGRLVTAAGTFPGVGGADRSPTEELPVVESTLQQLAEADLAPFVATASADDPDAASDAFVTSLVRYRAVQQQPERPLSLDSGGLRYLWAQVPALGAWRAGGGLLVSPGLGLPAVRRYVDPDLLSFNARRVIRETLAAGNDILNVANVGGGDGDAAGEAAEIEAALDWLVAAYAEDEAVRELVDAAVVRVLERKVRTFGRASLHDVLVDAEASATRTGLGGEDSAQVARRALTLIAPSTAGAGALAPRALRPGERILLVVDEREVKECDACAPYTILDAEPLVEEVRRTYGPDGTARLRSADDVTAVTFAELKAWLQARGHVAAEDTPTLVPLPSAERLAEIGALLRASDWLVFAMRDVRPAEHPGSDALKLFLKAGPPEAADHRIVALAFAAPYYLDTTEIAKLTAYYAVYSASPPFVSVAVRALFGDEPAVGASPVSIPGAGYDLDLRLQPAIDQALRLELVGEDADQPLDLGSTLRVRTSPVVDGNGQDVPDGTAVTYRLYDRGEDVYLPDVRSETRDGRALATLRAERKGEIEIQAVLDNGLRSEPLVLSIASGRGPLGDALPLPQVPMPAGLVRPRVPVDFGILVLSLGLMLLAGVFVYGLDGEMVRLPARMLRLFLLSLAWGLAGYLLVAAGGMRLTALPGGGLWPEGWNPAYQAPAVSFCLALVPLVPTLLRASWRGVGALVGRPVPSAATAAVPPEPSGEAPVPPSE